MGGKGEQHALKLVKTLPTLSRPGESFNYIATNYLLIQRIIEVLTGQSYEKYIRSTQWKNTGLIHTVFGNSGDVVPHKSPTYSFNSFDRDKGEQIKTNNLRQVSEVFPASMRADAGVFSTATDLTKWLNALKKGKLLTRQSIQAMWSPVRLNSGKYDGFDPPFNSYALGWPVAVGTKYPMVASIGGGRAVVLYYPNQELSVVLLTNLTGCSPEEIAEKIADLYL